MSSAGGCHAHNVGVSLLQTVGDAGWVAHSCEEYVDLAAAAAADLYALSKQRLSLRPRMLASAFCDGSAFVQHLESVYEHMYKQQQQQQQQQQQRQHQQVV